MKYKNGAVSHPYNACQIKSFKYSCGSPELQQLYCTEMCRDCEKNLRSVRKPITLAHTELDLNRRTQSVSTSMANMIGLLHPTLTLLT